MLCIVVICFYICSINSNKNYQTMKNIIATPTTEINFSISGRHESHHGTATIVENYNEGTIYAENNLPGDVKTRQIGSQDGYSIFENYTDSGSVDYVYFAVKN